MYSPENLYQRQSILNAHPTKLVVKMYDLIAKNCYLENKEQVNKLLAELIHHLNFDYDLSSSLFEIYSYCQRLNKDSKFEEIIEVLNPLRITWEEVSQVEIRKQINLSR
jgi:flagellin-specific chaperone FliS